MVGRSNWKLDLGAWPMASGTRFRLWAPFAETVAVRLWPETGDPIPRDPVPLEPRTLGYFEGVVPAVGPGPRYTYVLDGTKERPDPASRFQPEGVHGPSAVVDPEAFEWTDRDWTGVPLDRLIIYELHAGTFTQAGTFEAIIPYLEYLRDEVGVTAIELMPVAQFPGTRNWGYDGVYPFAPQASYGGPQGLKTLINACHAKGLAVILDVVYNHLGPEGNYLGDFGPYFTDRYRTPWGRAINYDGPDSDEVRHFIVSNALYWVTEYHVDGLRLDAIHGIYDFGARHILRELAEVVHAEGDRQGRSVLVIAESDLNDVRVIAPPSEGGHGLDAQWNDDFHHALHTLLTGEREGYYRDFGRLDQFAAALRDGFVYTGQRSAHRRRRHGSSSRHRPAAQLVVCAQNHDQVGNRAQGDRLSVGVPPAALKVAAAAVLLAPNVPLLFMGEEYGETAPFQYFTDHGDPALAAAVREGRRTEFAAFTTFGSPDAVPDPQDPRTFERSRVHPVSQGSGRNQARTTLLRWYRRLIELRQTYPSLAAASEGAGLRVWTYEPERIVAVHRWAASGKDAFFLMGFNQAPVSITIREPAGTWTPCLDAATWDVQGAELPKPVTGLTITQDGVSLALPPYPVRLYLGPPHPR